jgi:hypothetical protein
LGVKISTNPLEEKYSLKFWATQA